MISTIRGPVREGDFVFIHRDRIALVVAGENEVVPAANFGNGLHAVDLRNQAIAMPLFDGSVCIKREKIAEIAHTIAEYIRAVEGLSEDAYAAATKLLDPEDRFINANRLFVNPRDRELRRIFDRAMEMVTDEKDLFYLYEIELVAFLAIFSEHKMG